MQLVGRAGYPEISSLSQEFRAQSLRPKLWLGEFQPLPRIDSIHTTEIEASVEPSIVCSKCRTIRVWLGQNRPSSFSDDDDGLPRPTHKHKVLKIFEHHSTGTQLERSCAQGCHLCTLLWQSILDDPSGDASIQDRQTRLTEVCKGSRLKVALFGQSGRVVFGAKVEHSLQMRMRVSNGEIVKGKRIPMTRCPSETPSPSLGMHFFDSSISAESHAASCTISTASTAVWQLALKWVDDCNISHKTCKPSNSSAKFVPTRLIDVGPVEGDNPRLTITATDHIKGPYLALSYCWGGVSGLKLTNDTVEELELGLPLHRFPTTIQDAIKVTRKLSLRYIWIDSLCILQDSGEDWTREASAMRDVYANCFLTIAALGATDSGMGLFGNRDPLMYKPCWMFGAGADAIFAHPRDLPDHLDLCFHDPRLHTRGWVMQERILSPRTLNFGTTLVWECREKLLDEYMICQMEDRSLKRWFYLWQSADVDWAKHVRSVGNDFLRMWSDLLSSYTESKLTFRTDRLLAVSGLIRFVEGRTGWTNIAGLWRPFMIQQLLWKRIDNPQSYRNNASPTWSWWAIDGPVDFAANLYGSDFPSHMNPGHNQRQNLLAQMATVEALEVTSKNDGLSHRQYTIRLTCNIVKVSNLPKDGIGHALEIDLWPPTVFDFFRADTVPLKSESCYLIPLLGEQIGADPDRPEIIYGLAVVSSTAVTGAYERIGFIETRQNWKYGRSLRDFEKKTIKLI